MCVNLICLLLVFLCFVGCGSHTQEDFRDEGQRRIILLINQLRTIKTQEQLLAAQEGLKIQFNELVDLMIRAREARLKYPEAENLPLLLDDHLNIDLQAQLQRVCRITGGLEILERSQEASLNRLDCFERNQEANLRSLASPKR